MYLHHIWNVRGISHTWPAYSFCNIHLSSSCQAWQVRAMTRRYRWKKSLPLPAPLLSDHESRPLECNNSKTSVMQLYSSTYFLLLHLLKVVAMSSDEHKHRSNFWPPTWSHLTGLYPQLPYYFWNLFTLLIS